MALHLLPQATGKSLLDQDNESAASQDWRDLARCSTAEARSRLPWEVAKTLTVLPLSLIKGTAAEVLTLGSGKALPPSKLRELKFISDCEIEVVVLEAGVLATAIFAAYHGDDTALHKDVKAVAVSKDYSLLDKPYELVFDAATSDAARLVQSLLKYALAKGASDIHIAPRIDGTQVTIRVDGVLLRMEPISCIPQLHKQMISRLKVLAGLDITKSSEPQDGRFNLPVALQSGLPSMYARLSVLPTVHGEKAVIRFLGREGPPRLETLGINPALQKCMLEICTHTEGAVLISGPTGSGKSTTLYGLLVALSGRGLSVVSIEDPVEILIPEVSQTSLNEARGLDHVTCIRSVLRQDPDVIAVGELRDARSAQAALTAAMTGHVVLASVHAPRALEVLMRLRHLGIDDPSIAHAVKLIIAQRLLPKLCQKCRVLDLEASQSAGFDCFKAVGCPHCDYAGHSGRVLAMEALLVDGALRGAIESAESLGKLKELLSLDNFVPLEFSLKELLRNGAISRDSFDYGGATSL